MGQNASSVAEVQTFYNALKAGKVDEIADAVCRNPRIVKHGIKHGNTAWHVAARVGQVSTLQGLSAALHTATLAKFNYQGAADIDRTSKSLAKLINMRNDHGQTPLMVACEAGHTEAVMWLLTKGADPWLPVEKCASMAAVHFAVRTSRMATVEALIEYVDSVPELANARPGTRFVDIRTSSAATPLHYAAWLGKPEMVRVLVQHGASLIARCGYGNTNEFACNMGSTPLHLAARKGHAGVVRELLRGYAEQVASGTVEAVPSLPGTAPRQVDPRVIRDAYNKLPFQAASSHNHYALLAMLHPMMPLQDISGGDAGASNRLLGPPKLINIAAPIGQRILLARISVLEGQLQQHDLRQPPQQSDAAAVPAPATPAQDPPLPQPLVSHPQRMSFMEGLQRVGAMRRASPSLPPLEAALPSVHEQSSTSLSPQAVTTSESAQASLTNNQEPTSAAAVSSAATAALPLLPGFLISHHHGPAHASDVGPPASQTSDSRGAATTGASRVRRASAFENQAAFEQALGAPEQSTSSDGTTSSAASALTSWAAASDAGVALGGPASSQGGMSLPSFVSSSRSQSSTPAAQQACPSPSAGVEHAALPVVISSPLTLGRSRTLPLQHDAPPGFISNASNCTTSGFEEEEADDLAPLSAELHAPSLGSSVTFGRALSKSASFAGHSSFDSAAQAAVRWRRAQGLQAAAEAAAAAGTSDIICKALESVVSAEPLAHSDLVLELARAQRLMQGINGTLDQHLNVPSILTRTNSESASRPSPSHLLAFSPTPPPDTPPRGVQLPHSGAAWHVGHSIGCSSPALPSGDTTQAPDLRAILGLPPVPPRERGWVPSVDVADVQVTRPRPLHKRSASVSLIGMHFPCGSPRVRVNGEDGGDYELQTPLGTAFGSCSPRVAAGHQASSGVLSPKASLGRVPSAHLHLYSNHEVASVGSIGSPVHAQVSGPLPVLSMMNSLRNITLRVMTGSVRDDAADKDIGGPVPLETALSEKLHPCASSMRAPAEDFDAICGVCFDNDPEFLVIERCRHKLCLSCARELVKLACDRPALCVYCRAVITGFDLPLCSGFTPGV